VNGLVCVFSKISQCCCESNALNACVCVHVCVCVHILFFLFVYKEKNAMLLSVLMYNLPYLVKPKCLSRLTHKDLVHSF
jgi:hypothetical protein